MIRRWSHGHSLATGLVFGLVLDREALVIFAIGVALGAAIVWGSRSLRSLTRGAKSAAAVVAATAEQRARLAEAEIERKQAAAAEARARAEHRTRTVGEQKAAERRAYWTGARDGGWLDDDERPKTILGVELDDVLPERAS